MKNKLLTILLSLISLFGNTQLMATTNPLCPQRVVEANGCTGLPDGVLYENTFTNSCNNHDVCYATVGADKDHCDSAFKDDMQAACGSKYSGVLQILEYEACMAAAQTNYLGVINLGDSAYNNAQANWVEEAQDEQDNPNCELIPESAEVYSSSFVNKAKTAIESATGKHANMPKLFAVMNQYTGGESQLTSWENNVATSAYVGAYINGIPDGEAKVSITYNTGNTQISAATSTGTETKIVINGLVYGDTYTDTYTFNERAYGSTHYYNGYAVTYIGTTAVDYHPINFTRVLPKDCNLVSCNGNQLP
jgi:hypothetical protein